MKRASSSRPVGLPAGASTRAVLERLAQVLISNGASPSQLSQQFSRACRRAIPPPRPSRRAGLTSLDHSHVLSHWYRDPRFLDASGAPRALPLAGPGVSLKALVRRVFPRAQPEAIVANLAKLGAVSRSGTRYRPTGRYVSLSEQREEGLEWLLTVLRAAISTTAHNITCLPGERLLARSAVNPKFPTSALATPHTMAPPAVSAAPSVVCGAGLHPQVGILHFGPALHGKFTELRCPVQEPCEQQSLGR